MIIGTGVDIIEVARVEKTIARWGDHFLKRVFCPEEIAYCRRHKHPAQHFAARFAAKEAVLKAFGDNGHIGWKDIVITNNAHGQPVCTYSDKKFNQKILISLSHTENYAVASATITT